MKNNFEDVMSKRTDEELTKIIGSSLGDYQPEAVEAAEQEIKKRQSTIVETPSKYSDNQPVDIQKIDDKKDLIICWFCGEDIECGLKVCPLCNGVLEDEEEEQEAQGAQNIDEQEQRKQSDENQDYKTEKSKFIENPICPKCRKTFSTGTVFCSEDGTKLVSPEQMILKCVKCGKVYTDGTKFCSKCGGKVILEAYRVLSTRNSTLFVYIAIFIVAMIYVSSEINMWILTIFPFLTLAVAISHMILKASDKRRFF